jgi:hypothetical protein
MIRTSGWVAPLAVVICASPACACNVPVFRFALEKWPADLYEVVIIHRGELSASDKALVQNLTKDKSAANCTVEVIDLAGRPEEQVQALLARFPRMELPFLLVRYPRVCGIDADVWTGKLSAISLKSVLDSPARQELARRLLRGDSAVWLLLESGVKTKDESAARLVQTELRQLENKLKLPSRTDDPEDRINPEGPPLRVAFSLLRVSQADPAEQVLVRMLLNSENDLSGRRVPMVFPIYGRSRALYALVGSGINQENIAEAAQHVVGPCTCTIKEQNPGVDLLVSARWDDLLTGRLVKERPPPPLPSLADFATHDSAEAERSETDPSVVPRAPADPEPPSESCQCLAWNIALAILGGLAVLTLATVLLVGKGLARS